MQYLILCILPNFPKPRPQRDELVSSDEETPNPQEEEAAESVGRESQEALEESDAEINQELHKLSELKRKVRIMVGLFLSF